LLSFQVARLLSDPELLPSPDFAMYWAAGRLNAFGQDPYDPERLLPLQAEANPGQAQAFIMYSPPFALTLVMPFGLLESHASRLLWLLLHFAIIMLSADWAWRLFGGPGRYRWLAWALAMSFLPTLFMLRTGQVGSLVLLGVVGFVRFQQCKKDVLAGALLALTLIKPHVVYLVLLAAGLWVLAGRRWAVLLGGGLVGLAATIVPLATNRPVLQQYHEAITAHPPLDWVTPTPGTLLRLAFGADRYWLQFLPMVPGLLWFASSWLKNRADWEWTRQAPPLVLVSLLTTCYGAWSHDYVVALLPVIQVAAWTVNQHPRVRPFYPLVIFCAIDVILALQSFGFAGADNEVWLCWMSPVLLLSYLFLRWLNPIPPTPEPVPLSGGS
jgi:hypothetical protein